MAYNPSSACNAAAAASALAALITAATSLTYPGSEFAEATSFLLDGCLDGADSIDAPYTLSEFASTSILSAASAMLCGVTSDIPYNSPPAAFGGAVVGRGGGIARFGGCSSFVGGVDFLDFGVLVVKSPTWPNEP